MEGIIYKIIFIIPAILVAFVVHEISHGYVAYLFGDPTAKYEGRFSIDPRKHIDPIGAAVLLFTLLFTGMVFGWAKPVRVNPYNFRNPRQDMAWVAFAGPLSNFTMAAIAGLPLKFGLVSGMPLLGLFIMVFVMVNIGLGLFNMIPIPPLDGSKILYGILPSGLAYKMMDMEARYAQFIPFILMFILMSRGTSFLLAAPYSLLLRVFTGQGM
jgi:Zn-dependent protease